MKTLNSVVASVVMLGAALGLVASAAADGDHDRDRDRDKKRQEVVRAQLTGYSEVPSQSVPGSGAFKAVIDEGAGMITYSLEYADVAITQSHLHLGQHHTNGGISVFLCTNLGNAPAGPAVQACPAAPAEITGVIMAANVSGPAGQGIVAGEFAELLAAIRSGSVYVNIHTPTVPAGEIRGQLRLGVGH